MRKKWAKTSDPLDRKAKEAILAEVRERISMAAETLLMAAQSTQQPFVMLMVPQDNDRDLSPGEFQVSKSREVTSCVDGVVLAFAGTPDEMKGLLDLLKDWQAKRSGDSQ